jgi:hypothetical protein
MRVDRSGGSGVEDSDAISIREGDGRLGELCSARSYISDGHEVQYTSYT